jgi:hypothetical protein
MVLYTQIKGKPDQRKQKTSQTDDHKKYNNYPLRKSKKEEATMTTRTQNDVRNFNEAISKCRMPVFLVSSDGTQYNMKSADQNKAGMARWIRDFSRQMEIFTCDLEDEMIMMRYLLNRAA